MIIYLRMLWLSMNQNVNVEIAMFAIRVLDEFTLLLGKYNLNFGAKHRAIVALMASLN